MYMRFFFFFSSRRRHTRSDRDWSSDVCSSDLPPGGPGGPGGGGGGRAGGRGGRGARGELGSNFIVFALRHGQPVPVPIKTGLTDQDYIEVTSGLTEQDTVLVLPSASLVQAQQQFRQRFQNVTGRGLPGLRQPQCTNSPAR